MNICVYACVHAFMHVCAIDYSVLYKHNTTRYPYPKKILSLLHVDVYYN